MSEYIRMHPEEAYNDEVKTLKKAFKRRRTFFLTRWVLLFKTLLVCGVRIGRLYARYPSNPGDILHDSSNNGQETRPKQD